MFGAKNNVTINALQNEVDNLNEIIERKNDKIQDLERENLKNKEDLNREKLELESEKKILLNELDTKISYAVKKQQAENNILKQENAVLLEKNKILEKAFENMGFDVKDMKDILNKLVDGIVGKNVVNIVK